MTIDIVRYKLRITFDEPLLGSAPLNAEIYTDYIAAKGAAALKSARNGTGSKPADIAAEVEAIEESGEKGRTGFLRDELGRPCLMDYHIKGFCKDVCGKRREHKGTESAALKAYKTKIAAHVFVTPRYIPIIIPSGGELLIERPLRAETAQGPRVALASSEAVPKGSRFECTLLVLAPHIITETLLNEWFEYGRFYGFGQWRSGGWGKFEKYTLTRFVE